jgi:RNA methyltransferase, TrmH family
VAETPRRVSSRHNPRYQALKVLAWDKRARRESGRTLLDGEHLLEVASSRGARVFTLLATPARAEAGRLDDWCRRVPGAETLVLSEAMFKALAPSESPTGLMAEVAIPSPVGMAAEFGVLLEDIQDPGNLGALLRSAAAAGADAAYLSKGCAEAWSPKALRGSQGAQFLLDVHEQADLAVIAGSHPGCCHAAVPGASTSLYELDLRGPCFFAFGNEGAGLSPDLVGLSGPFSVPMPGRGMESLNVAAAAAVCLFERVRQRQAAKRSS